MGTISTNRGARERKSIVDALTVNALSQRKCWVEE